MSKIDLTGMESYDIARSEEQKNDMLESLKNVYGKVVAVSTTDEADPQQFPWTIYVDHKTIIR